MKFSYAMRRSSKGFAQIIIIIIAVILVGGAAYYLGTQKGKISLNTTPGEGPVKSNQPTGIADPTANWKTYFNMKYGYSIKYPADWTPREYPDTKTGAAFRPTEAPDDFMSEFIQINLNKRDLDSRSVPFADYVKIAAPKEIQNYENLASITKIVTKSGIIGYETTWNVQSMMGTGGGSGVAGPITYFDSKDDSADTIQVTLSNEKYKEIYEEMLLTFNKVD